jgi:hypothetical protein
VRRSSVTESILTTDFTDYTDLKKGFGVSARDGLAAQDPSSGEFRPKKIRS